MLKSPLFRKLFDPLVSEGSINLSWGKCSSYFFTIFNRSCKIISIFKDQISMVAWFQRELLIIKEWIYFRKNHPICLLPKTASSKRLAALSFSYIQTSINATDCSVSANIPLIKKQFYLPCNHEIIKFIVKLWVYHAMWKHGSLLLEELNSPVDEDKFHVRYTGVSGNFYFQNDS